MHGTFALVRSMPAQDPAYRPTHPSPTALTCERPALCVQTNSTSGTSTMIVPSQPARRAPRHGHAVMRQVRNRRQDGAKDTADDLRGDEGWGLY